MSNRKVTSDWIYTLNRTKMNCGHAYVALALFIAGVTAQSDFPAAIPSNTSQCYYNATLNSRYNRGPFSMDELIALIRKVEIHPTAQRWTIQKMAGVLLRRFRYDGIKDAPGLNSFVPITKDEVENDKFKLTWSLLPGQPWDFPEDALTTEEKCTLHWILSYSVNRTQRVEERQVRQPPSARLSISLVEADERMPYRGPEFESLYSSLPLSQTPLEMGVVYTRQGTVAAGNVLAGILSGLAPQTVSVRNMIPVNMIQNWKGSNILERTIDSRWAVTLAGHMGQTALLRRPPSMTSTGPRGTWNNTVCPREYALEDADPSYLTTAELYGSIDGLILSLKKDTWDKDYLKLSALLNMYYSERGIFWDKSLRACNRLNIFKDPALIDGNVLKEQSTSCALAYFLKGMADSPSIPYENAELAIGTWVSYTYDALSQYLRNRDEVSNDFTACPQVLPNVETNSIPATYTDLTVVIDQYNDDRYILSEKQAIANLATQLNIHPNGSRLELVSSVDGTPYIALNQTLDKARLACEILNADIRYGGRLFGSVMSALRNRIALERQEELYSTVSGGNARVVLFLSGSGSPISSEKELMKTELELWAKEIPDVRLLFVTTGSREEYKDFVTDYDKDIFQISGYERGPEMYTKLTNRLAELPARLTHPNCNTQNATVASLTPSESSYKYINYVTQGTTQYYMIRPEYFFSSSVVSTKFTILFGWADICMSRTRENPTSEDTCKSVQQSGQSAQFDITSPCGRARSPNGCSPIYFAIKAVDQDDGIPCSDTDCQSPEQVRFTFAHDGMLCNSASLKVASTLTLMLSLWMVLLRRDH